MAWGTFEPAVRYIYRTLPDASPLLLSFVYYCVATAALAVAQTVTASEPLSATGGDSVDRRSDDTTERITNIAGLELGTYLFAGNLLQVIGLQTVPSDRAAFLLQLTTVFVPLLQGILSADLLSVPSATWLACTIALAGVALIGLEPPSTDQILQQATVGTGDVAIVLAAVAYTFHCLRLGTYAKRVSSAVGLAKAKAAVETGWSGLALLASTLLFADSTAVQRFLGTQDNNSDILEAIASIASNDTQGTVSLSILWIGLVTIAYTIYAQSVGQAVIKPTTANLIYSSQPVWTVLVAWITLGETATPVVYAGGLLIGAAVLLVLRDE